VESRASRPRAGGSRDHPEFRPGTSNGLEAWRQATHRPHSQGVTDHPSPGSDWRRSKTQADPKGTSPSAGRSRPEGGGTPGGARSRRHLKRVAGHRIRHGEQTPEAEGARAGAGQPQERTLERHEGSGRRNPERIHARDKPLKAETLNAAAGRNKPAKPKVEQTVEGVRNAEGGASERADLSRGNSAKDPGAGTGADTGTTIDRSREEGAEPHGRRSKATGSDRRIETRNGTESRRSDAYAGGDEKLEGG